MTGILRTILHPVKRRAPGLISVVGALGLFCLVIRFLLPGYPRTEGLTPMALTRPVPPGATPSQRALWEGQQWRRQALLAAESEREAREACDPDPLTCVEREASRRWRLIAADRNGHLARASAAALRAAALARTPRDAYRAAALLAGLACYAGHHDEELRHARRLVEMAPRQPTAWLALRRAARCTGREALDRQANAKMAALAVPVTLRYRESPPRRDPWAEEPPVLAGDDF
jgi:hypothetical protein